MGVIELLALALGAAWTSGINLYATVAALGLAQNAGLLVLPPELLVLGDPLVVAVAVTLYCVEFFADKIPGLDNAWDAVHTFIRVPAGALIAAGAVGHLDPALGVAAALAGGSVALASHGMKASARLAINTSPEPFSNWTASVSEDAAAVGVLCLAYAYPYVTLVFVAVFLVVAAVLVPRILGALVTMFGQFANWLRRRPEGPSAESVKEPSIG